MSPPSTCCWRWCKTAAKRAKVLKDLGATRDKILNALVSIRGSQRITDPNPEEKYQALEKYGRDLTDLARKGKLDPVIGRDDEIRRVIQVLSRRTKNNPVLIGEPGVGKTAIVEGLALAHRQRRRARRIEGQKARSPSISARWSPERNSAANLKTGSKRF